MVSLDERPYQTPQDVKESSEMTCLKLHRFLCIVLFLSPSILLLFLVATPYDVDPIDITPPVAGMRSLTLVDAILGCTHLLFLALSCSVALLGERKHRMLWVLFLTLAMVVQCIVDVFVGAALLLIVDGSLAGVVQ